MKKFAKVLLSVVLGFLAPLAFIIGGSLFENNPRERLAGCVAIVVYCAACQFLLLRKDSPGFSANWPILGGMLGGLLAGCTFVVEGGLFHNWPQFGSGSVGSFGGFLLATRSKSKKLMLRK